MTDQASELLQKLKSATHLARNVPGLGLVELDKSEVVLILEALNEAGHALRDIISIAKDANATTLGDIVKRAEEELAK